MTRSGFVEGGHQLEKLEFALAVAEARGDSERCSFLRDQITDLGGNAEEPGTLTESAVKVLDTSPEDWRNSSTAVRY